MGADDDSAILLVLAIAVAAGTVLTAVGIARAGRFDPRMLLGIVPMTIGALIAIVIGLAVFNFVAGLFG